MSKKTEKKTYEQLEQEINDLKKKLYTAGTMVDKYRKTYGEEVFLNFVNEIKQAENERKQKELENRIKSKKINISNDQISILMIDLFFNRTDVYPYFWTSKKTNKSGYSFSCKNAWIKGKCQLMVGRSCKDCEFREYKPLTGEILTSHLFGDQMLGTYAIDLESKTKFVVLDFDGADWKNEVISIYKTCLQYKVPASLEISKSKNGAHLWIFFKTKIYAKTAREFARTILFLNFQSNINFSFKSFDRIFPSQDYNDKEKSLGSIVLLPLSNTSVKNNANVFCDLEFVPYENQFGFLSIVQKIDYQFVKSFIDEYKTEFLNDGFSNLKLLENNANKTIHVIKSKQLIFELDEIKENKELFKYLRSVSSFINPEYIIKQRQRFSTYNIPFILSFYDIKLNQFSIPRGLENKVIKKLNAANYSLKFNSNYNKTHTIEVYSTINLTADQQMSLLNLLKNNSGILIATPGYGKTIVGLQIIATLKVKTLILVHTEQIAKNWQTKINTFFKDFKNLSFKEEVFKDITIQTYQYFIRKTNIETLTDSINLLIIDECHHVGAPTYSEIVKNIKCKYIYGLTATLERSDGTENIVKFMIGEPVKAIHNEKYNNVSKTLIVRSTEFNVQADKKLEINDCNSRLVNDLVRNEQICEDIIKEFNNNKKILVLSEQVNHLNNLKDILKDKTDAIIELHGQLNNKEKQIEYQKAILDTRKIILATGKYLGEGFDLPDLDTLFITFPFKFHGTLKQYIGRLRKNDIKKDLVIYDYFDKNIYFYYKMFLSRNKIYKELEFEIIDNNNLNRFLFTYSDCYDNLKSDFDSASMVLSTIDIKKLERDVKGNLSVYASKTKTVNSFLPVIIFDKKVVWYFDEKNKSVLRIINRYLFKEILEEIK